MATDLRIDEVTGDLVQAPGGSFDVVTGPLTIEQSVRIRLKVIQDLWNLDPTNGRLGSRLHEVLRMPTFRAVGELPLAIREALEPMDNVSVQDVQVDIDPNDGRSLNAQILFTIDDDAGGSDVQTLDATFGVGV